MKLKKLLRLNSKGFAHVEMLAAVAVIAMVGVVGIYISKHNNSHALAPSSTSTSTTSNTSTNTVTAANTASVSCGWIADTSTTTYNTYTQQEPQNVQLGAPYCFTYNGHQCEFYTQWGKFEGTIPYAKLMLVSGTDCATNYPSANNREGINQTTTSVGSNYKLELGPYSFNQWSQATAPHSGSANEAFFQACIFATPGNPNTTEGCMVLVYNGT